MIILTKNSKGRGQRKYRRVDVFTYCKGLNHFSKLGWKYHDADTLREESLVKDYIKRNEGV